MLDHTSGLIIPGYLSRHEFARRFGLQVKTLATWASLGKGPAVTLIGRRAFYSDAATQEWLASLERPAGTPRRARRARPV
jgi:hypothetical protein